MNRLKKIYVLLAVLVVVSAAAFGVSRYEEHKEEIQNSDEVILTIDTDSVTALSWENETESLSLHKDEAWLYDDDEAFPVDEEKIAEMLQQFQEFGVSFIIENVEDFGQYGLDDPICTIHMETSDGETYDVQLGDYSTMDSERYVYIGGEDVYLVKHDPLDNFNVGLSDIIDNDEIPSFDDVSGIRFTNAGTAASTADAGTTGNGGTENTAEEGAAEDVEAAENDGNVGNSNDAETRTIIYEEDSANTYCADDVYFMEESGSLLPLDTTRVNSYLNTLDYLNLSDYVTYNATEQEIAEYGLDDPELTVSIDYAYEEEDSEETISDTFTMAVSRSAKDKEKIEKQKAKENASKNKEESEASSEEESGASAEDEEEEFSAYVRVGESQIIYEINSTEYKDLLNISYDSLRHLSVFTADFDDITQIDISLEGTEYAIAAKGKEDDRTYSYQNEEIEIEDFQTALQSLAADSFTDEQPAEKEEISLTVHLDNENYPTVQIALYRYDGTHCLAVVDGEPVSLIDRSQAVDLIEAVYAIVL